MNIINNFHYYVFVSRLFDSSFPLTLVATIPVSTSPRSRLPTCPVLGTRRPETSSVGVGVWGLGGCVGVS